MNQSANPVPPNAAPAPAPTESSSSLRETMETIVFVVVLVLLLKTFVAEAFVIPTGSMATTLYGDHKDAVCPQCGLEFPVNCSAEHEAQERGGHKDTVVGCTCPNCRYRIEFGDEAGRPACRTGDRVIVSKFAYDLLPGHPSREDIVVFKYPREPQRDWSALNYIKRLVGLPGETIAIHYGDLYVYPPDAQTPPLTYADRPRPDDPNDLWQPEYMYARDLEARALFQAGKFRIVRKEPAQIMAMRRLVYDNDHRPKDLEAAGFPPRWAPEAGSETDFEAARKRGQDQGVWKPGHDNGSYTVTYRPELAWLRYRHLVVDRSREIRSNLVALKDVKPSLITDYLGYNTYQTQWGRHNSTLPPNWVGDLMLECKQLKIIDGNDTSVPAELILELSRGVDRFQARWDVRSGVCQLVRLQSGREEVLDSQPTPLRTGAHEVRFANVDERLLVWVDGRRYFGDGVSYPSPAQRGPTANDLEPASVGIRGASADVRGMKLWRDTYYTTQADASDEQPTGGDWSDPRAWEPLRNLPERTYYVQPGHYLCLGDNSPQSSDGRYWGLVPQRLMLGRALLVYFPLSRMGAIR
jgi:signal peptidase I